MKHYKFFLISLIILGTAGLVNGQSKTSEIGIEGGPGLSIIYSKTGMYSHSVFTVGGVSGVFYQYNFSKLFSFKTGLTYERKGTRLVNKSDQLPEGDLIYKFDYLSLPLLIKVSAGRKVRFLANAGPCFSYLLNQSWYSVPTTGKISKLGNDKESYKIYDLGILLGIGMSVPINDIFIISIEARENYSLVSLRDNYNEADALGYFISDNTQKFNGYANSVTLILGFACMIP